MKRRLSDFVTPKNPLRPQPGTMTNDTTRSDRNTQTEGSINPANGPVAHSFPAAVSATLPLGGVQLSLTQFSGESRSCRSSRSAFST